MGSPLVGIYLAQGNRIEESFAEMKKVRQIDPLSPVANTLALIPALTGRQYDVAIGEGRRVLEMDRGNGMARWLLATAYERKGDLAKAIEFQEETAASYGKSKEDAAQRSAILRRRIEREGPAGYWRAQLEENEAHWKESPGDPYGHAALYARVGNRASAFAWLEKAYQARSQELIYWLRTDPAFDALRADSRYKNLVQRIGFPQ